LAVLFVLGYEIRVLGFFLGIIHFSSTNFKNL
jgi:hypothetical protein